MQQKTTEGFLSNTDQISNESNKQCSNEPFSMYFRRKTERDVVLPDMFDIKGTSSLVNIAKNVLLLVRLDKVDHQSKAYKKLRDVVKLNNYDLDEADSLVCVAKTKGRRIGYACLKFNKKLGQFYDCKKLDSKKEFDERVTMYSNPKKDLIPITDTSELKAVNAAFGEDDGDLPY